MGKIYKYLYLLMFFLFPLFLNGQEGGEKVYFKVKAVGMNSKIFFKMDSTMYRITDTVLLVSKGPHSVQVWSPTYTFIDSTIIIKNSDTTKYIFGLMHTKEYDAYKWNYSEYKRKSNQRYLISPIFVGLSLGGAMYCHSAAKMYYNSALLEKYNYSVSGSQKVMDQYESNFNNFHKKYKIMKSAEYGLYGLSALIVANYVRLILKQRRIPVPIYKEKIIFSRVQMFPYMDMADNRFKLQLKIKF